MDINDQLQLAQLRWPDAHIGKDQYGKEQVFTHAICCIFNPRDPEFILWLCFELKISVIYEYGWQVAYGEGDGRAYVYLDSQDQIIDAVLEVALEIKNETE